MTIDDHLLLQMPCSAFFRFWRFSSRNSWKLPYYCLAVRFFTYFLCWLPRKNRPIYACRILSSSHYGTHFITPYSTRVKNGSSHWLPLLWLVLADISRNRYIHAGISHPRCQFGLPLTLACRFSAGPFRLECLYFLFTLRYHLRFRLRQRIGEMSRSNFDF